MSHLRRRTFFQAVAAAGLAPAEAAQPIPGHTLPAPPGTGPELRRGPYLQAQGPDRVVVRWRTDGGARDAPAQNPGDRERHGVRVGRLAETPKE